MKFIKLLFGEARRDRTPLLLASTLPGVMMSGVIALVTTVANYDQSKGPNLYLMAFFVIASVALLLAMNYALNATKSTDPTKVAAYIHANSFKTPIGTV